MIKVPTTLTLGSDPECFLEMGGVIVGSERVIPKYGLDAKVVRDGVQLELHAAASSYSHCSNLSSAFSLLKKHLKQTPDIQVCFTPFVSVSRQELDSLSDEARILGCEPSQNFYGLKRIEVDGRRYRKRSAGGHIHMGLAIPIFSSVYSSYSAKAIDERNRIVPIMDILVGNTCVMLDRDPNQIERRKLYGKAGEYRTPRYGLEYRTLSNFWLRSPVLASFVFEMTKMAVGVLHTSLSGDNIEQELFDIVNLKKIIKAIQKNDAEVARDNWEVVKPYVLKHFDACSPIPPKSITKFEKFLETVTNKGLEAVFPEPPLEAWTTQKIHGKEWYSFLEAL